MDTTPQNQDDTELESLEAPQTQVESTPTVTESADGTDSSLNAESQTGSTQTPPPGKPPKDSFFKRLHSRMPFLNVYLLLFVMVLLAAAIVGVVAYLEGKHSNKTSPIATQTLDSKALEQVANTDTTVGSSNQILNVQSSAVFAGKVLVRDSLEVAGNLQIGGNLSLAGVSVSGSSIFGQVQINKNLAVAGDSALQGSLTVQKSLTVNSNGSFSGNLSASSITTSNLQLNGDLNLNHHITAGGPNPSRTNGSALGSGGTATVNGSDTSGAITINTGGGASAGCFISVNFTTKFNATPHVIVTPIGQAAGGLAYYVERSTSSFSICDASTPPANASFGFDYMVLD